MRRIAGGWRGRCVVAPGSMQVVVQNLQHDTCGYRREHGVAADPNPVIPMRRAAQMVDVIVVDHVVPGVIRPRQPVTALPAAMGVAMVMNDVMVLDVVVAPVATVVIVPVVAHVVSIMIPVTAIMVTRARHGERGAAQRQSQQGNGSTFHFGLLHGRRKFARGTYYCRRGLSRC